MYLKIFFGRHDFKKQYFPFYSPYTDYLLGNSDIQPIGLFSFRKLDNAKFPV